MGRRVMQRPLLLLLGGGKLPPPSAVYVESKLV